MRSALLTYSLPDGVGAAAMSLQQIERNISRHLNETVTIGRDSLRNALAEIQEECQTPGWDGYDAKAIPNGAFLEAGLIIEQLPPQVLIPDIVPEPSGAIGFEWRKGLDRIFLLSVSGACSIVYAGVLGGRNKTRGVEDYFESLPFRITELLRSHFSVDFH